MVIVKKAIFFISIVWAFSSLACSYVYAYEPAIYEDGWKTLSKEELNKRMGSPVIDPNTGEPLMLKFVDENGEIVERACAPSGCDGLEAYEYTTYDIIRNGIYRDTVVPLNYYTKAQSSKHSYVRDFTFDQKDPMVVLPVDFVSWVGSDQREFIDRAKEEGKSWRDISPSSRIIAATKDRVDIYDTFYEDFYEGAEKYEGEQASHVLSLSVLGDLNGDGYEDLVLSYAHYWVGGSGRSYRFVVLTRKSEEEIFQDITDEVDEIISRSGNGKL